MNNQGELFRSLDGASTWTQIPTPIGPLGASFCELQAGNSQCFFDLYVAVDPKTSDTIYLGGIDLYRSVDGGATWVDLGGYGAGYLHVDQHAFAFNSTSSTSSSTPQVYVGNDGGVWSSQTADTCSPASCWTNRNLGLDLAQFYSLAMDPKEATNYFAGAQDNGGILHAGNNRVWTQVDLGDRGSTLYNSTNPLIMYSYGSSNPRRSTDGGITWTTIGNGLSGDHTFMAPMAMSADSKTLYLGTDQVFETTHEGGFWTIACSVACPSVLSGEVYTSIQVAPSNAQIIYTATNAGRFFFSANGGSTFDERDLGLPSDPCFNCVHDYNHWITKISVNATTPQNVFVTLSGGGGKHVFMTTDYGTSWTDITSNLPDYLGVTSLALGPAGTVYVGTDFGAYFSTNRGTSWSVLGTGLPTVPIFDLELSNGALFAATYGRGVWLLRNGPQLSSLVRGNDGNIYSSGFLDTWSTWVALGGSANNMTFCSSGPGTVELVVQGSNNQIYHRTQTGGVWSSGWDSPGGMTDAKPSCAVLDEVLYLVVKGIDDSIWYASLPLLGSGSWSSWTNIPGTTLQPPLLVSSPGLNRMDLIVIGTDNVIYHKAFIGNNWASSWDSPTGLASGSASVVSDGANLFHLVVRGMDGSVWYTVFTFDLSNGSWGGWTNLNGIIPLTPPAVALTIDAVGSLHLVVRGVDGGIYHKTKILGGSWSQNWDSPGGVTGDTPAISPLGSGTGLMVRGEDGLIYFSEFLGTAWSVWVHLSGTTTGAPEIVTVP